MWIIFLLACLLGGYLLGSLNASIIFGFFKGSDIRNSGSKNAGMTNTLRVFGKKAAVFVFVFDLLKAIVSVVLARYAAGILYPAGSNVIHYAQYLAGFGAILGHNFPLYFKFKGGKGILSSWGVIMVLDWRIAILLIIVFLLIVTISRYVSLASIISATVYPLFVILLNIPVFNLMTTPFYIALSLAMASLAIYRHRGNIQRLCTGTESKLGQKKE